jgi:hypothetical protein
MKATLRDDGKWVCRNDGRAYYGTSEAEAIGKARMAFWKQNPHALLRREMCFVRACRERGIAIPAYA